MSTTEMTNYYMSEYTQGPAEMGWCPDGNHASYKYEVNRFAVTTAGGTKVWRVMLCSCGYANLSKAGADVR